MPRSRRRRLAPLARGVLLLAAALLLPLAAALQAPRETAAQAPPATQDSLWSFSTSGPVSVCTDPSSPAALSGCFAAPASTWESGGSSLGYGQAVATDGTNVYAVSGSNGALSCPITGLGTNCSQVMAGPWPRRDNVLSLAVANGYLWIGQDNGYIYRCPANLPWAKQDEMPSQCMLLDDAGKRAVVSLLLANNTLYAGLGDANLGFWENNPGYLWSCSPDTPNSCAVLDMDGDTWINSLAAGGGYLWAGLGNGILWRCDLNATNACANWDTAGNRVESLSYAGPDTIYAAVGNIGNKGNRGVIWSCLTADANRCGALISNVSGLSVAAGAGNVFSSTESSGMYFGTSRFTAASDAAASGTLIYLPAEGPAGVGSAQTNIRAKANALGQKFRKRCNTPGKTARATITITGQDFTKTMKAEACSLVKHGLLRHYVDLLDPGDYTVSVTAGKRSAEASFTIEQDKRRPVNVKLTRGATGG